MKTITLINPLYRKRYLKHLPNQFDHLFLTYDQALVSSDAHQFRRRFYSFFKQFKDYPHTQLFKPVQSHLDTAQQFLSMFDLLDQYQIEPNELPQTNEIDIEKKEILEWMRTLNLYRPYVKPQSLPYEKLNITAHLYTDYQLSHLNHAHRVSPPTILPNYKAAFKALNPSQEIEAVAQYLQKHQRKDVLILHGSLSEVTDDFVRFFSQYGLDFQITYNTPNVTHQIFLKLIALCQENSLDRFIDLLNLFPFGQKKDDISLLVYLKQYRPSYDSLPMLNKISNNHQFKEYSPREYQAALTLEAQAQRSLNRVFEWIKPLDSTHPLTTSFKVLQALSLPKSSLINLKNQLESLFDHSPNWVDVNVLEHFLSEEQRQTIEGDSILIGSLKDLPPMKFETIILMGLNQHNFPLTSLHRGFFDELYLSKIEKFPTLEERQEHLLQQFNTLYQSSETLIYSTHRISFDGKTIEQSFELDQQIEKENLLWQDWPYQQNLGKNLEIVDLEKEVIDSLVFDDGLLKGSVSSFETYFNASYQYFIEHVLYIREPRQFTTDVAMMGTIAHNVLEQLVKDYPQTYFDLNNYEVKPYLKPYFKILQDLYPNKENYIQHVFSLTTNNLIQTLQDLKSITPLHQRYQPFQNEYRFVDQNGFDSSNIVVLNGFIDRIDRNANGLLILDYKSSDKSLSAQQIYNGQQLQLILYGIVASRIFEVPLLGVFYISLLNSIETLPLIKHRKSTFTFEFGRPQDQPISSLKGYNFEETNLDNFSMKQIKDLEQIFEIYQARFEEMIAQLKQGKIDTHRQMDQYFSLRNLQRYQQMHRFYPTIAQRDQQTFNAYSFSKKG